MVQDRFASKETARPDARGTADDLKAEIIEIERVQNLLGSLASKSRHEVMVPFGEAALFPGELVRTNECLVSLGDSHLAEYSVEEASQGVLERRKGRLQASLAAQGDTRNNPARMPIAAKKSQSAADEQLVDIREAYDAATMNASSTNVASHPMPSDSWRGKETTDAELEEMFSRLEKAEALHDEEALGTRKLQRPAPKVDSSREELGKKVSKPFARGFLDRRPKAGSTAARPLSEPQAKSAAKPPESKAVREQTAFLDRVVERTPPAAERGQTSEAGPDAWKVPKTEHVSRTEHHESVSGPAMEQSKPAKLSRFKQQRMR